MRSPMITLGPAESSKDECRLWSEAVSLHLSFRNIVAANVDRGLIGLGMVQSEHIILRILLHS